jgi:hypothetical protein
MADCGVPVLKNERVSGCCSFSSLCFLLYSFSVYHKDVAHKFWCKIKDHLYTTNVQRMLAIYRAQDCKLSLKVHFLHSLVNYFPENLGTYKEEHKVNDFTRLFVISKDATKIDGMLICQLTTAG